MKIFLTGASGFVGSEILRLLLENNYEVFALFRSKEKVVYNDDNLEVIIGDILDVKSYESHLRKCDVIINLVGIIREIPRKNITFENLHVKAVENLICVAKDSKVKKIIHMSANGARENAVTNYHKTKYKGERLVIHSDLKYTIFKPSVIYGPNDAFVNMLANLLEKTPIFSYFGKGEQKLQPVSVEEVSEAFVKSIDNTKTDDKVFNICGNKILSYKELLRMIMKIKNIRRVLIPVPILIIKTLASFFGRFQSFPLTTEQLQMLLEGNICEDRRVFDVLNIDSIDIENKLFEYLK
jgi:NADH dehydrogenase